MDNHLQIFSLKSNLISNAQGRGGSINFSNQKYNPHMRMKSLCFSNMLQNIKVGYNKDKLQQKQIVQNQKQNNTMIVQAKNFKFAYGHETPLIVEPPRMILPHSRSFLIRSHYQKKAPIISSQIKSTQNSKQLNIPRITYQIPLKQYNFKSAQQLKVKMVTVPSKNNILHHPHLIEQECPQLTILMSSNLIKLQCVGLLGTIFDKFRDSNISIIIVCTSKERAFKLHQIQQINKYSNINIIYPDTIGHHQYLVNHCLSMQRRSSNMKINSQAIDVVIHNSHHNDNHNHNINSLNNNNNHHSFKNRQVFIDMHKLGIKTSKNILVLQSNINNVVSNANNINYRQNHLYFPYFSNQNSIIPNNQDLCIQKIINKNKSHKISFVKIPFIHIIKQLYIQIQQQHKEIISYFNNQQLHHHSTDVKNQYSHNNHDESKRSMQHQYEKQKQSCGKALQLNQHCHQNSVVDKQKQKGHADNQAQKQIREQQIQESSQKQEGLQQQLSQKQNQNQVGQTVEKCHQNIKSLQNRKKSENNESIEQCNQVCIINKKQQYESKILQQDKKIKEVAIEEQNNISIIEQKDEQLQIKQKIRIQFQYIPLSSGCVSLQNLKKPSLIVQRYPLNSIVKLQLQKKHRLKTNKNRYSAQLATANYNFISNCQTSTRLRSQNRLPSTLYKNQIFTIHVNQMQVLQQKLLQYAKIVKKQSDQKHSNNDRQCNSTSNYTNILQSNNNAINKQGRKSLNNKSYYQIVNELIRNNQSIYKQITSYTNQCKEVSLCQMSSIVCDNVQYYLLE